MSSTSLIDTDMKPAPSSPATARAMNVFPQPGGPYINSPPRRLFPYSLPSSGLRMGARNAASRRSLISSMPPTSASVTVPGVSTSQAVASPGSPPPSAARGASGAVEAGAEVTNRGGTASATSFSAAAQSKPVGGAGASGTSGAGSCARGS